MQALDTSLDGVLILEPSVFEDERGYFVETWNQRRFAETTGVDAEFVQDNQSGSARGVLRGLHYQVPPHAQGKLIRAVVGSVYDVAVDLRRGSPTFGGWFGIELSSMNHLQLWIPTGFAHGFIATSDWAEVHYKVTDYYSQPNERALRWDDPEIGIVWPTDLPPVLSDRDADAVTLQDAEVFS
jgi:dTDP-4-dehydrorhamnose 3,5-epimerase